MRLRRCLLVCALVLVMPLGGLAQELTQEMESVEANRDEKILPANESAAGAEAERAPLPVPTPLEMARRDAPYKAAYHDVYHILSGTNPCSSFFGGSSAAVEVLNNLFSSLQVSRLPDAKVGLTMSGRTRNMRNARTGVNYRLFEKAVINTGGPFYQRKFAPSDPLVPNVGSFQPNTREARAAILLHEMGHLIKGANGQWLLPNDGASDEQSRRNTATIEYRCGEQIKGLQRKGAEPTGSSAPLAKGGESKDSQ